MSTLKLPALKISQPIGTFYLASIPARELVKISYSDVRRLAEEQRDLEKYLGIQRPISRSRIKAIKKYIVAQDATFPTAVILAIDERCADFHETNGCGVLTLQPYEPEEGSGENPIPYDRIAKVIDGQHRIAAFLDENQNWSFSFPDRPFDINLAIFIGADVSEQANVFATVNLAQTKVNRSLVYDLTELAKTRSPHKTCHDVAVALDAELKSPLYHRIKRLGIATPGRAKEPLTQASFVEALVPFISQDPIQDRNNLLEGRRLAKPDLDYLSRSPFRMLFWEGREVDIAEIIFNYFDAVRSKWPESWAAVDKTGNLLPRSNAFKALMKYLHADVYPDLKEKGVEIPKAKAFARYFSKIELTDTDFTTKNFAPGSGGQSTFLKLLRGELHLKDILAE